MQILFLSSEVAPWSKTGGLADVAASLPAALAALGHQVVVASPFYASIPRQSVAPGQTRDVTVPVPAGAFPLQCRSVKTSERLTHVFIESAEFFSRPGFYGDQGRDYADNALRFGCFTKGALLWAQAAKFVPDIVHANDWQTGLAMLAIKREFASWLPHTRGVFTIHNLAYQGNFAKFQMEALGIEWNLFNTDGVEFFDQLSFMKTGIQFADAVTTVSPTYAREIQSPEFGMGLEGVIRKRGVTLTGILNGIDTQVWNPATDVLLPAQYTAGDVSGKAECRRVMLHRLGISARPGMPVFSAIGRMVHQKGADVLQAALPPFLEAGAAVAVLGTGDPELKKGWLDLQARFPRRLSVTVGFDESLAHLLEAGSDYFLMPSRFEPCGLNQMYSLRYGAVPIVHQVGGLADSVVDVARTDGTGITFSPMNAEALRAALNRAVDLFSKPASYSRLQSRGMNADMSWARSAARYQTLYSSLLPRQLPTLR